jgi:hypothetical protein
MSEPGSILQQAIKLNRQTQPNALAATEDFEFEALSQAVNYRLALRDEFRSFVRGDVLEVGAGVGQFTQVLATLPEVKRIAAVEPEPRFCEAFRRMYPDRPLVEGTIDAIGGSVDFDALVSINVITSMQIERFSWPATQTECPVLYSVGNKPFGPESCGSPLHASWSSESP